MLNYTSSKDSLQFSEDLLNATGPIPYGLTNDYMFRVVLQSNEIALKGLVCSLLHFQPEEITSLEITNPIEPGTVISDKEFRLDIKLILNSTDSVNIEMQVIDYNNWPERSLSYLSREYDSLNHGEDYMDVKKALHISILDYTLFRDYPEFYATYKMMNEKNHHVYSDKFALYVLDLTKIELATDEDIAYGIDRWAALFKAKTWEEIRMIAQNNECFTSTCNTLKYCNADKNIQDRCIDRAEAIAYENYQKKRIETLEAENTELLKKIEELQKKVNEQ